MKEKTFVDQWEGAFHGENFHGVLICVACEKFVEKTFMGGCKIAKFMKTFSLESFPLYDNRQCVATGSVTIESVITP